MSQIFALMTLLIFSISFTSSPLWAQTEMPISGEIQSVTPAEGGQFQLTVLSGGQAVELTVNRSTMIATVIPATSVKTGQVIMPMGTGGQGLKGSKALFGNLSAGAKKLLGLPNVPEIPKIPKIPKVPKVPKNAKAEKGAPAPGEASGPAMAGGGAPPPDMGQAAGGPPKKEPEEAKIPEDSLAALSGGKGLSAPTAIDEKPKKVLELKKSKKEIRVSLEGEGGAKEEVVLMPADRVIKMMGADELQPKMNVSVELAGDPQQKIALRVIVLGK